MLWALLPAETFQDFHPPYTRCIGRSVLRTDTKNDVKRFSVVSIVRQDLSRAHIYGRRRVAMQQCRGKGRRHAVTRVDRRSARYRWTLYIDKLQRASTRTGFNRINTTHNLHFLSAMWGFIRPARASERNAMDVSNRLLLMTYFLSFKLNNGSFPSSFPSFIMHVFRRLVPWIFFLNEIATFKAAQIVEGV